MTFLDHKRMVNSVQYSRDGMRIVSSSGDTTVKIWNSSSYELIATMNGHTSYVYFVNFSPDGKKIISGSADNTIKVWNATTYSLIDTLIGI